MNKFKTISKIWFGITILGFVFAANISANNFLALGPISPEKINVRKLVADYKSKNISNNIWCANWKTTTGDKFLWKSFPYNINLKISKFAKIGDTYIFQSIIDNHKEQYVRFIGNTKNIKNIFLNDKEIYGQYGLLPKGKNKLVLIYICPNPLSRGVPEGRGVLSYNIPFSIIGPHTNEISFSSKPINNSVTLPKNTDGKLKFFITDKSSGKKKPCRLYVFDQNGRPQYDDKCPSCFGSFTCNGEAELFLPEGEYTFEVESGKEFYNASGKINIKKGKTFNKKIKLERFSDINNEGWFAGDMHNHTKINSTPLFMESENIHISYVPNWWINPPMGRTSKKELSENYPPLIKLKNNRFLYTRTGEDERNDCTLMFFNMPDDVEIPEATWTYPPNVHFAKEFGKISNVWVHLDHTYWWQTPAILACGELDSIEVINNNFVRGGMNQSEAWGKPRDKKKYPNPFGNAEYQQDVYFKILNCGLRIPPSAGSAAPVGGGPFGYNRVYVHVDGKLTWEKWWQNLKLGKCFITCGPLLRVTANEKFPGHIFKAKKSIKIKPEIKLDSRDKITKIQIIKNGKILKYKKNMTITFDKSGWFLVRALTENTKTYRFAMTAPYYVEIGNTPKRIDKESVEFFLNWAKEAAKQNPETEQKKRMLFDKYSKETLNFWQTFLNNSSHVSPKSQKSQKPKMDSKAQQLKNLKSKQILVAMWGWDTEIIAPAATNHGFEVVIKPGGNVIEEHKKEIPIWKKSGLKMLVRPHLFAVKDPFDKKQIKQGYAELEKIIKFHEKNNPNVVGYVIMWGFLGEGGFLPDYKFSEKARKAFNKFMKTPGMPLPEQSQKGLPGTLRWVKWLEFRSKTLSDFREEYVKFAKQFTDKLVGTWSEFYAVDNYILNMGDAPGSDFFFYDLSFGDVTCNQKIALAESHGNMETFSTFEAWKDYILPLMAKGAGEGVTPMSFQFPMTRGAIAEGNTNQKKYYVDKIEDEYSLKIGPYMKKIIDAAAMPTNEPDVALVYDSFQAGAMPADSHLGRVLWPYYVGTKQIESSMHQMGIDMKVIPYEWLETHDLSKYKIVIVPDPMYLNSKMRKNLKTAKKVLFSGEFLLTHRDENSQSGNYTNKFKAKTFDKEFGELVYFNNPEAKIVINKKSSLMKNVKFPENKKYVADQMFAFKKIPKDSKVLAKIGKVPFIFTRENGKIIHVANRAFAFAWTEKSDWLEKGMFTFLKNLLKESGVNIRVKSPAQTRANLSYVYGSYGVSGNMAWNMTDKDIEIEMSTGTSGAKCGNKVTIPKHGWTKIK